MKRLLTVAWYVLIILALAAIPALAQGPGPQPQPRPQPQPIEPRPQPQPQPRPEPEPGQTRRGVGLMGQVISCDGETLTVTVLRGGPLVTEAAASGDPVVLTLDPERTRIHYFGTPAREPLPADEWVENLPEGTPVSVRAAATADGLLALSVVIGVPGNLKGTVVSYEENRLTVTLTEACLLLQEFVESGDSLVLTLDPGRTRVREYGSLRGEWVRPDEWPQLFVEGTAIHAQVICQVDSHTAMMVVAATPTDD